MAWGIMMTVVTLFGMIGVAIFEATSEERPPTKPKLKQHVAGKEMRKAA